MSIKPSVFGSVSLVNQYCIHPQLLKKQGIIRTPVQNSLQPRFLGFYQGLDLLIDAAALCPTDARRPVRFLIVGDGVRRDEVVNRIAAKGLRERFILRPSVPHGIVLDYLNALDIEVISVYDERTIRYGLSSLKFWEAMAVGLPILVPDRCGLGEVLDGFDWPASYPTGDAEGLSRAITETIEHLDTWRSRRDEVHEAIARDHSWAAVAAMTEEVFTQLLAR